MEIFRIAAVGIITALCVLILRDNRSDIALLGRKKLSAEQIAQLKKIVGELE